MSTKKIVLFLFGFVVISFLIVFFVFDQFGGEKKARIFRIGLLQMASTVDANMEGFRKGMEDLSYVDGANVEYDYFNAEGDVAALSAKASEFASKNFDLIFANTSPATQAIRAATSGSDIPVVFSMVADPVYAGFVQSIHSSGNNLAGTSCAYIDIAGKRLEILKSAFSGVRKVLVFFRPGDKSGEPAALEIKKAGQKLGVQVLLQGAENSDGIRSALSRLAPGDIDAIMDPADAMVTANVDLLVEAAFRLRIPLMMMSDREAERGAALTYGVDYFDLGKQSARLAARILEGAQPTDIPIEMPRIFRLVVNLKTAQQIGLEFSSDFLAKADRVIK